MSKHGQYVGHIGAFDGSASGGEVVGSLLEAVLESGLGIELMQMSGVSDHDDLPSSARRAQAVLRRLNAPHQRRRLRCPGVTTVADLDLKQREQRNAFAAFAAFTIDGSLHAGRGSSSVRLDLFDSGSTSLSITASLLGPDLPLGRWWTDRMPLDG